MVAEAQRFEDAARIAMGDYSSFSLQAPSPRNAVLQSVIASGRVFSEVVKFFSKSAA